MNSKVNLGNDIQGNNVEIDLDRENIHFIILAGESGSGKSVFHERLYKELIDHNNSKQLGFIVLDTNRVELASWESSYLIKPPIVEVDEALDEFERLGKESILRAGGKVSAKQAIIIHIEECNMIWANKKRFEKALVNIVKNKNKNNMFLVFSSSKTGPEVFTSAIMKNADLKVIFKVYDESYSKFLMGESLAEKFTKPGKRVLVFKNKQIICQPFTEAEIRSNEQFFWPDLYVRS